MSTVYYVTFGYGYHLTEDDVRRIVEDMDPEDLDEMGYESAEEYLEEMGYTEVVDNAIGHMKNFSTTSTWFYDYNFHREEGDGLTGFVIYRKATTGHGEPGQIHPFPKNTEYNQAELDEWKWLEETLGHPITFDAFVEVSIG